MTPAAIIAAVQTTGIALAPAEDVWPDYAEWQPALCAKGARILAECEADPRKYTSDLKPFLHLVHVEMLAPLRAALAPIAAGVIGAYRQLQDPALWVTLPTHTPSVYSQQWHRDPNAARTILKVFLHLHGVDKTNGPFEYMRGSQAPHAAEWCPLRGYALPLIRIPADRVQRCVGPAGMVVFADTSGIHRGGNITHGHRLQAVFGYAPARPVKED